MLKSRSTLKVKSAVEYLARPAGGSHRRGVALSGLIVGLALTAAACSSAPAASPPRTTLGASNPSDASPTTSSTAGSAAATLAIGSDKAGAVGTVLTGPNGHTLYELTTEHNGKIECTGSCAQIWPPLVVTSGQSPKLATALKGTLGSVKRPEGTTQVTYDGHPLYYYAPDSAPGQAKGQGVGGVWFAVAPGESSMSATTTTTSGGYSY
jgi:predicted lipoprotein with Yx(FWY)xxD motif